MGQAHWENLSLFYTYDPEMPQKLSSHFHRQLTRAKHFLCLIVSSMSNLGLRLSQVSRINLNLSLQCYLSKQCWNSCGAILLAEQYCLSWPGHYDAVLSSITLCCFFDRSPLNFVFFLLKFAVSKLERPLFTANHIINYLAVRSLIFESLLFITFRLFNYWY